ncbi:hypothetical protein GDO78_001284 [Eleutherodactylus coqui]|uniref:Uncharacterized protein n=1 Tax=Eleutherodactylus coqui TaxID=57060 RepID=A0A8J6FRK8_ELECQ|nr:hypothetical protein GDO78_001284 [Eleutherodactylus coqui]
MHSARSLPSAVPAHTAFYIQHVTHVPSQHQSDTKGSMYLRQLQHLPLKRWSNSQTVVASWNKELNHDS